MTENKPGASDAPEKMGTLYSSINVHDAGYRDFSASRIDTRARFRYRVLLEEKQPVPAAPAMPATAAPAPEAVSPPEPPRSEPLERPRETLERTKERVASRWFALKSLFARSTSAEPPGARRMERHVPVLAFFSFAGGVGKTSLAATLGRALASHGERVLLAETAPLGLLPFYFGASGLKAGAVRTFAGPKDSADAPIDVVTLDVDEDRLVDVLLLDGEHSQRILVDVQTASEAVVRRLFPLMPMVLAPLLPAMNSVATVSTMESIFSSTEGARELNLRPIYLLNQFDPSLPLHVDVREILRERLGDRLLPFVMRRSPEVSEALAEGMTVVDYAPNSSITEDFLRLADWFRSVSAIAAEDRGARWSER